MLCQNKHNAEPKHQHCVVSKQGSIPDIDGEKTEIITNSPETYGD